MKYIYAVVTAIPDIRGNLYNPILYKQDGTMFMEAMKLSSTDKDGLSTTSPLAENFSVGEILILNPDTGREITGKQRKPGKWDIEVEEFTTLTKAINRALEVSN